jgi:fumarate hydratase class II
LKEDKAVSPTNAASNVGNDAGNNASKDATVMSIRKETDSLGEVDVPSNKLWGAQTQRSLEHFSIGQDLIPREMIAAYATLKKAAANANHAGGRLDDERHRLIVQTCDEILSGRHQDMFPLHVWMTVGHQSYKLLVILLCLLHRTPLCSKSIPYISEFRTSVDRDTRSRNPARRI